MKHKHVKNYFYFERQSDAYWGISTLIAFWSCPCGKRGEEAGRKFEKELTDGEYAFYLRTGYVDRTKYEALLLEKGNKVSE